MHYHPHPPSPRVWAQGKGKPGELGCRPVFGQGPGHVWDQREASHLEKGPAPAWDREPAPLSLADIWNGY